MNTQSHTEHVVEAAAFVKKAFGDAEVAIILGSGLNDFADSLDQKKEMSFDMIPHMPKPSVAGHFGKFCVGFVQGKKVYCLAGRIHAYEGYCMNEVVFATQVMRELGVKVLLATNAAGGAQDAMSNGCIMAIKDHINLVRRSPLEDTFGEAGLGSAYVNLHNCYSPRIMDLARKIAKDQKMPLFEGNYAMSSGPSYETPSEVLNGRKIGCDAFGMSTVPETVAAISGGMEFFALSVVTNMGAGLQATALNHVEVQEEAKKNAPIFKNYILSLLAAIDPLPGFEVKKAPNSTKSFAIPAAVVEKVDISAETIVAAAKTVGAAEMGYIVEAGMESAIPNFTEKSAFALTDIAGFPAHSPSAFDAKIVNGNGALVVYGLHAAGLNAQESIFVANVFAAAGVKKVAHAFAAGASDETVKVGSVISASSILNAAQNGMVPSAAPKTPISKSITTGLEGKCMRGFVGPAYPSECEVSYGALLGCPVSTVFNMALLQSFAELEMPQATVCPVVYTAGKTTAVAPTSAQLEQATKALAEITKSAAARTVSSLYLPHIVAKTKPAADARIRYSHCHLSEVKATAEALKKNLPNMTESFHAILAPAEAAAALEKNLKNASVIPAESIPHLHPGKVIAGVTAEGKRVVAITGQPKACTLLPMADVTQAVRVFALLKATDLHVMDEVVSCVDNLSADSVVVIDDHVNLSGLNPLFGPNEATFGTRFPDMSTAYDAGLRSNLKEAGIASGAVAVLEVGGCISQEAYALECVNYGGSVITAGIAMEAITAGHCGLKIAGLGLVTRKADNLNEGACEVTGVSATAVKAVLKALRD